MGSIQHGLDQTSIGRIVGPVPNPVQIGKVFSQSYVGDFAGHRLRIPSKNFSQSYVEDVVSAWPSKHVQYAHAL